MNNVVKISVILTIAMLVSTGCSKNSSTTKTTNGTSELKPGTGTGIIKDEPAVSGCDGIERSSASRCYYKNIDRITLNGAGNPNQTGASSTVLGPVLWSSLNNLPGYDQSSFNTDLTFNLRIKALMPIQNEMTVGNRSCSNNLSQFKRIKVFFMLRNSVTSLSTYFSAEAKLNEYSKKIVVADEARIPSGAPDKILEVVGILTDHRCLLQNPPIGCAEGTYWGDIPTVVTTATTKPPTGCASFKIEYATDTTYDLPN